LGDGSKFYSFNVYDNYLQEEIVIKGIVDKNLGVLPKEEIKSEFSEWCKCLKNKYKWETLELIVSMENEFHTVDVDKPYLFCRLWITEK
jgi:hypothetical protein